MKICDLSELEDCYDTVNINEETNVFSSKYNEKECFFDLVSDINDIVYDRCMFAIHEPNFLDFWEELIEESIQTISGNVSENDRNCIQHIEDEIISTIIDNILIFIPPRSKSETKTERKHTNEEYKIQMDHIINDLNDKNKTIPEQRTTEWYEMRYNTLSASNLWKLLHTDATYNQLIKEKTTPMDTSKYSNVNINSTLHWGQKYEPVSQSYYEHVYDTQIEEYGCILHDKYECIGASPDGMNIKRESPRYGRLLEIKNIINRDITGIPKKEYWIQMQIQMECCNALECDFLECRFKEYKNEIEYMEDAFDETTKITKTKSGHFKGVIMCFTNSKQQPEYEYMPFTITTLDEYEQWQSSQMDSCKDKERYWVINTFWYLSEVSCVLVERNQDWFNSVLPDILNTWIH